MAQPQGPSFIPKRSPVVRRRKKSPRRLYVFSVVAYTLIFGSVLTAAGVFLFKLQIEVQMVEQQRALSEAVNSFSNSDLAAVKEFERRLWLTYDRMDHHYALSKVFFFLEESTAATVEFKDMTIFRMDDEWIEIQGTLVTDTLNSVIFQRDLLGATGSSGEQLVEALDLTSVSLISPEEPQPGVAQTADAIPPSGLVQFNMVLVLNKEAIEYTGLSSLTTTFSPEPAAVFEPEVEEEEDQVGDAEPVVEESGADSFFGGNNSGL